MMKEKTKRKDLAPPEFALNHWQNNKKQMTVLLRDCNFDRVSRRDMYICTKLCRRIYTHPSHTKPNKEMFFNRLEKIVVHKEKQTLLVDQGWYSEEEMKSVLKWSQCFPEP
jgi:hypothetical protein